MDNELWQAITELSLLLRQSNLPEEEYQLFFERNPCVFDILGFDCHAPFDVKSGNKLPLDEERDFTPMPDFICGKRDIEEAVVFEIKRPDETRAVTSRADGNRAKLRANIESHVSQTCEYVKSIRGNSDARRKVRQTFEMSRIRSVSGFLLCGKSDDGDAPVVAELIADREPRIQFMYYDKLYEKMCDAYARNRTQYSKIGKSYKGSKGVTLTVLVSISPEQEYKPAYLIDIGEARRNRVSIYTSETAHVNFLNSGGEPLDVKVDVEFGLPHLLYIEFSNDPINSFLSVSINNREILNVQRQDGYQICLNFENLVVGSNLDGQSGSCCILGTTIIWERVFGIDEKIALVNDLLSFRETEKGVEFNGAQYLRKDPNGNLTMEDKDAQPKIRKSLYYNRP